MPALTSQLDQRSQDFQDNAAYHRALVAELDRRLERAADGGGEKARDKHAERGKLLPHKRSRALLDPGSFSYTQLCVYKRQFLGGSNTAIDSTCAVCGNMSITPASRSVLPASFTR